MPPVRAPRSTRDRPAKPPLSTATIVDEAIAILRSDGLPALTMRRVASALDTGAGSLYVYVANRDDLLRAVLDRVLASVELEPPDPARWREQLHSLLTRLRDALAGHPGLAAVTMIDPPRTEAVFALLENLLGLLLAGGVEPQRAVWAADVLTAQVTFAAIEAELRTRAPEDSAREVSAAFADLPAERFPLITRHAAELVTGTVDERFRFAVDVLMEGVATRPAAPHSKRGAGSAHGGAGGSRRVESRP